MDEARQSPRRRVLKRGLDPLWRRRDFLRTLQFIASGRRAPAASLPARSAQSWGRIKFNLMVSTDCEPTSTSRASAINRHIDRVFDPSRKDTN